MEKYTRRNKYNMFFNVKYNSKNKIKWRELSRISSNTDNICRLCIEAKDV